MCSSGVKVGALQSEQVGGAALKRSLLYLFAIAVTIAPVYAEELPQSPGTVMQQQAAQGSGSIAGQVLDTTGAGVAKARVTLVGPDGHDQRVIDADERGAFLLEGLDRGPYRVIVAGPGFEPYVSAQIPLTPLQAFRLEGIELRVATASTTVDVTLTMNEIATEQVKVEEKQRVLGILPNFYTSFAEHPAPLTPKLKFSLAAHSVLDPTAFLAAAAQAGGEYYFEVYPGYGYGFSGYAKRYAASYGDQLTNRYLTSAIFPALLHQDPRYFYQGTGSIKSRIRHAIVSAMVTRTDTGGHQPNYSYLLGDLTSGALSNLYYPHADRGGALVFRNTAIGIAGHAADNLIREFVLKGLTTNLPPDKASSKK